MEKGLIFLCMLFVQSSAWALNEARDTRLVIKQHKTNATMSVCLKPAPPFVQHWHPAEVEREFIVPPLALFHFGGFYLCRAHQEALLSASEFTTALYEQANDLVYTVASIKLHQLGQAEKLTQVSWQLQSSFISSTCRAVTGLSAGRLEQVPSSIMGYCLQKGIV